MVKDKNRSKGRMVPRAKVVRMREELNGLPEERARP